MKSVRWGLNHQRAPQVVLGIFCLILLVIAVMHPGHGVESTDIRTYVQMIAGVARHGLPYWDNGPIDQYEELVVPWGVPARGHLWGVYAPLYAYAAAPAFLLGSLRGVSAFTFATLVPIALVTYLLARRFVENVWYAVLAAVLTIISTPILAKAVEMSGYPLAILSSVGGTYLAVSAILAENGATGRSVGARSFGSGFAWGCAVASHAACFPMALASLAAFGVLGRRALGLRPVALAGAGFAVALAPVSLLNRIRFQSLSPLSYGPIPWRGFDLNPVIHQNVSDQLKFAKPVLVVLAIALVIAVVLHKRPRVAAGGALAAIGAALLVSPLARERAFVYAQVLYGYVVDMTLLEMGGLYRRAPDGVGQMYLGWAVRATLQCTPLVILAPLFISAMRRGGRDARARHAAWIVLLPAAALYAAMCLRANMGMMDSVGLPWVYLRYTLPALPMLVVASVVVVERARLRLWDAGIAIVIATGVGYCFCEASETSFGKRVLLVIVPLAVAFVALVAGIRALRSERGAAPALRPFIAAAIAMGVAGGLGQELRSAIFVKRGVDAWLDAFDGVAPARFAVFGPGGLPDTLWTTTVTHDVRYAMIFNNPYEEIRRMRPILEHWRSEGRPVFMVWDTDTPPTPWPDVAIERVQSVDHLFTVRFVD